MSDFSWERKKDEKANRNALERRIGPRPDGVRSAVGAGCPGSNRIARYAGGCYQQRVLERSREPFNLDRPGTIRFCRTLERRSRFFCRKNAKSRTYRTQASGLRKVKIHRT